MKEKEEKKFDRKKAITDMEKLKNDAIDKLKQKMAVEGKTDIAEEELNNLITVKSLENIDLINAKGEIIETIAGYAVIEEIGGQFQIVYYDENLEFIGAQLGKDGEITSYRKGELIEKEKGFEKEKSKMRKPEEEEIEKAKTLEQLQEEQRKEEEEQAKKAGPQLTKEQVNRLSGPKIALSQPVDKDIALKNKIGLQGDYIQFIDINEARKLIPDLDIAELGQQFLPIEILPNGTANVVSEDNMRFSTIKGSNSTEYSISENNDGTRGLDQSIVTFAIPGTNNYISVGFNEQHTSDPYYEVKFQTIDRDSNRMGGEELLQSHIGTIEDPDQHNERRNNTEGQLKYTKELVTEEQAEKYAKSEGIYLEDSRNPDLKTAREELERLAVGGKSVNDIVQESENDQLQLGHPDSKRHY